MASVSNAIIWITFAPISDLVERYYSTSIMWVNLLSLVFMAGYIPFGFFASWTTDRYGLRTGVLIGTALTLAGAWLRVAGKWSYWFVLGGQVKDAN
jgi:FLVCR family MFS transporter 7